MAEWISTVLASAAFGSVVTGILSYLQHRKGNELKYITEERRAWREKIRVISSDMEKCSFGDACMDDCIVRLKVNINPYGRLALFNYKQDSHIWKAMERLEAAENERLFNQYKKQLQFYLSLLLKDDWERSKHEIKSVNRYIKDVIFIIIALGIGGVYWFYIWNISNTFIFAVVFMLFIVLYMYIKDLLSDDSIVLLPEEFILQFKFKRNKQFKRKWISIILSGFFSILFFSLLFNITEQNTYNNNMRVRIIDDKVRLYADLRKDIFYPLKNEIEEALDYEMEFAELDEDMVKLTSLSNINLNLIKDKVENYCLILNIFIFVVLFLVMIASYKVKAKEYNKYEYTISEYENNFYINNDDEYHQAEVIKMINESCESDGLSENKIFVLMNLEYSLLLLFKSKLENKNLKLREELCAAEDLEKYVGSMENLKEAENYIHKLVDVQGKKIVNKKDLVKKIAGFLSEKYDLP